MYHTFISNRNRIESSVVEVCYQCATPMKLIRRHCKSLPKEETGRHWAALELGEVRSRRRDKTSFLKGGEGPDSPRSQSSGK